MYAEAEELLTQRWLLRQDDALLWLLRLLWLRLLRLLLLSLLPRCSCFCGLLLRVDGLLNHHFILEENLRMLCGGDRVGAAEQKLTEKAPRTHDSKSTCARIVSTIPRSQRSPGVCSKLWSL